LPAAQLYPRIGSSHTIVATSESSLFANVILRKGVIVPVHERSNGS
ncbi:MAG: RbsD/FucU domain-containing protein, partial [Devosia sp.]